MSKRKKPVLVHVHWLDSRLSAGGWHWVEDHQPQKASHCQTVGWVVAETKEVWSVAQNVGDMGCKDVQCAGVTTIPKVCVTKMKILSGRKKRK